METGTFDTGVVQLYYEKRGTGPAVLLIAGAGGDAGYFTELAERLAGTFTVITYDRRGNSRSSPIGSPTTVADQSDDAAALINGIVGGPALVFGNSAGAIVALDLAARHPEVIRGVIAHEPPVVGMLPADDEWADFFDRIGTLFREAGPEAAGGTFVSTIRGEGTYAWPEDLLGRFFGNSVYLFTQEWEAWGSWMPDEEALSKVSFPLLLGAGQEDRGLYYGRPSVEIAARVGAPWVEFPGIHLEFLRNPDLFAATLHALLTQLHSSLEGVPASWQRALD
jgi:pimeloyl-ACP methyl ester carboxylesterase